MLRMTDEHPRDSPGDLCDPMWIHVKGWLFLVIVLMASALILLDAPSLRAAALLALIAWASARFYYYLFYVIERYVDPSFRFAGVWSAVTYLLRRRRR